jgi:guanylate kinase
MNELKRLSEFKKSISDYNISAAAKKILKVTKLVLLVAPTSTGRNTIIKRLLSTNKYHYVVSDTTRSPRENNGVPEQNGVEYWFKSEAQFLENIRAGNYLEFAIIHGQQVSGIRIDELEKANKEKRIAISDFETQGVDRIKQVKPNTIALFILPPNFQEWQARISQRGEMDNDEYTRRMQSAFSEYKDALEKDYYMFIINDKINSAVEHINKIINGDKTELIQQNVAHKLVKSLYQQTDKLLREL